jgi:hypothetical protein
MALNANSGTWVTTLGPTKPLHPDFGGPYGIPFIVVPANQATTAINFTAYGDESDSGPYPIPLGAPIEDGTNPDGDRHVLALQSGSCMLYELYRAFPQAGHWDADSGAVFNLSSNALRPDGWTSADAAGLPILPGLVRYEDVATGSINHAIRFTSHCTQSGYIHPATHIAGSNPACSPMGARFRMKANFDLSHLTGQALVIAQAMKTYGMIVADNGSDWFFTGSQDSRWDTNNLDQLKAIPGSAFEAVDSGPILH